LQSWYTLYFFKLIRNIIFTKNK